MNIIIDSSQVNTNNIYYQKPIRNTVMDHSNFIRIIYSNELFTLNCLLIHFTLQNVKTDKYFSKVKCTFSQKNNQQTIETLSSLEYEILQRTSIKNKAYIYNIHEQLMGETIKLFANESDSEKHNNCDYILKISGVWETDEEIGVTYKFLEASQV